MTVRRRIWGTFYAQASESSSVYEVFDYVGEPREDLGHELVSRENI
jgi:hypothetical protein